MQKTEMLIRDSQKTKEGGQMVTNRNYNVSQKVKKWKKHCSSALIILLCAILFTSCTNTNKLIDNSTLNGKVIELGQPLTVSFDSEHSSSVKTLFSIIPTHGRITIKYISGDMSPLKINLYDTRYDEFIQTGQIQDEGACLEFSNLSAAQSYNIEIQLDEKNVKDFENIVLCFFE